MLETDSNWELFGYDTRQLGKHWRGAWRDLLWADDSPLRERLDEVVALRDASSVSCYHAGKPVAHTDARCTAILLPPEQYLVKPLSLPAAVADDLADVLALEVTMHSPFAADDTAYGWCVTRRDENLIALDLVIVSRASVMAYLGKEYDLHDAKQQEVWVRTSGSVVTLHGFGEALREGYYRKRVRRTALQCVAALVLILLVAGVAAGGKQLELARVQAMASQVEAQSGDVSAMRSALVTANETIAEVNAVVARHPSIHGELARLTALMDDDVFVEHFDMSGATVNLRGKARDAAAVMKRLNDDEAYASVQAPRAISRVRGTDLEQFHLQLALRGEAGQ